MINTEMITVLSDIFPELSEKQLKVAMLYAAGSSYESIAAICCISVETVRSQLKRSTKALNLKSNDSMRAVILLRTNLFMISMMLRK